MFTVQEQEALNRLRAIKKFVTLEEFRARIEVTP